MCIFLVCTYSGVKGCPTVLKIRTLLIFEISKKIDKVRLAVRYWTVLHAQEELGAHISTGFRSRMIFWKNHLEKKSQFFFEGNIFEKSKEFFRMQLCEKKRTFSICFNFLVSKSTEKIRISKIRSMN